MLGGVDDYIVKKLLETYYGNDESKVPYLDYIGSVPAKINATLASSYSIGVKSDKITQHGMRPISCWCHALIMHWT